jgi:tetratricopeptide (TPR) repeat protein
MARCDLGPGKPPAGPAPSQSLVAEILNDFCNKICQAQTFSAGNPPVYRVYCLAWVLSLAADMADIFISYSSQHRDLTCELATAIDRHFGAGSVWWDQTGLRAGDRFSPEITRALDAAGAVVVVWTKAAVTSDWVYAEAVRAANRRTVVTIHADDLDLNSIPLPFNVFHSCRIGDMRAVLEAIEKRLSGELSTLPSAMPGPGFRDFLLNPKQERLPSRAVATRPASLLLAKHQLVPFADIHGLRDNFIRWTTSVPEHAMDRSALGRLLHAPAGLGKTRALIEIADELTQTYGWLAGFVPREVRGAGRELSEGALERLILSGGDAAGLMLIVDYAESRQDDVVWLADRLLRRAENTRKPARLVLLSRGSEWWRELVQKSQSLQDLCSLGGEAYDEIKIPEKITLHDQRALFDASVNAFRAFGNTISPSASELRPPPPDFVRALDTDDNYQHPLAVQISALLHVAGVDADGRQGVPGLLNRILGLEYEYWDKALQIGGQSNWQTAVKNGVAQVTLVGAVDSQGAEELIGRDPLFRDANDIDVPRLRYKLSLIFPGEINGLVALEPDLIGEHHVLEILTSGALVDACLDWAGEHQERRRHILMVLNRATRPEHGEKAKRAELQLARLVKARAAVLGGDLITVAVATPGRLLDLCRALEGQVASLDESALAAIDDALPMHSLKLMELSLRVAERLEQLARPLVAAVDVGSDSSEEQRAAIQSHLADRVGTLGNRLSNLGRGEEALAATKEAVDIYQRLAHTRPDAFLPAFATSLTNLGVMLSRLGRGEEALAATQQAVDIYQRHAHAPPDAFARSLSNLGFMLSNLGRGEEALAESQHAVDIYRGLARTRPAAFLPDLAASLKIIGPCLSYLGRGEEALAATKEAVDVYRGLVRTRADAFLPDLAISLTNLGIVLSNLGQDEEALAPSQQAVDICRGLVRTQPDTFRPLLAGCLTNLYDLQTRPGRGGVVASQEAVDIRRRSEGSE